MSEPMTCSVVLAGKSTFFKQGEVLRARKRNRAAVDENRMDHHMHKWFGRTSNQSPCILERCQSRFSKRTWKHTGNVTFIARWRGRQVQPIGRFVGWLATRDSQETLLWLLAAGWLRGVLLVLASLSANRSGSHQLLDDETGRPPSKTKYVRFTGCSVSYDCKVVIG